MHICAECCRDHESSLGITPTHLKRCCVVVSFSAPLNRDFHIRSVRLREPQFHRDGDRGPGRHGPAQEVGHFRNRVPSHGDGDGRVVHERVHSRCVLRQVEVDSANLCGRTVIHISKQKHVCLSPLCAYLSGLLYENSS